MCECECVCFCSYIAWFYTFSCGISTSHIHRHRPIHPEDRFGCMPFYVSIRYACAIYINSLLFFLIMSSGLLSCRWFFSMAQCESCCRFIFHSLVVASELFPTQTYSHNAEFCESSIMKLSIIHTAKWQPWQLLKLTYGSSEVHWFCGWEINAAKRIILFGSISSIDANVTQ